MAPKKTWANPMRKRTGYTQYNFTVDDREYIIEVPDGVTTSIISRKVQNNPELYNKISSLAIERGYDMDNDTPPFPLVSKELYASLIRDAKLALGHGWKKDERVYIKNIVSIIASPYASILPGSNGTIRKKCKPRSKKGPPAAGDDPDDDDDCENYDDYKFPPLAADTDESNIDSSTSVAPPVRSSVVQSRPTHIQRISAEYFATDPSYKTRYALDRYKNRVFFLQDYLRFDNDPTRENLPIQIGYIEGPDVPPSGSELEAIYSILNGETQRPFTLIRGGVEIGGNYIYLLKPQVKLVILEETVRKIEEDKERKIQEERQAWLDSLKPTTYKGHPLLYGPLNTRGEYPLYEPEDYTYIGDYYPDSRYNPIFDEKKLENFGIQYTGYDTDSDEEVKDDDNNESTDDMHDYYDPHDDVPRFGSDRIPVSSDAGLVVVPPPVPAPAPAPARSNEPQPPHPPFPLPDGWKLWWSKSRNVWGFVNETTGFFQENPPTKGPSWRAAISKTYNRWYLYNTADANVKEWVGGRSGQKKRTMKKLRRKATNKPMPASSKRKRSTMRKRNKSNRRSLKNAKIVLRKVDKPDAKYPYMLRLSTRKRHLAIDEGVRREARRVNRTRRQAATAKKARLNVLRLYRKNNYPSDCRIITRDMKFIDKKYGLGATTNICTK